MAFCRQVSALAGYTIYSWLLHNWVFFSSNLGMVLTAIVGEYTGCRIDAAIQSNTPLSSK